MPEHCFRIRFRIDDGSRLEIERDEVELDIPTLEEPLLLQSYGDDGTPISETNNLVLRSSPFETKAEAERVGDRVYEALLWCGLRRNYGFDLGAERPEFTITDYMKDQVREQTGYELLEDVHGLQVYNCSKPTRFGRASANLTVHKNPDHFRDPWDSFVESLPALTEAERTALELWNVAYHEQSPRARFLTRMFSVEAILPQERSSLEAQDLVDKFVSQVNDSDLAQWEKDSLKGRLRWLKEASIRQRGITLANQHLDGRQYLDQDAADFFDMAYAERSNLVHDGRLSSDAPSIRQLDNGTKQFAKDALSEEIAAQHDGLQVV